MARSRLRLHEILKGLEGVEDAYFQLKQGQTMKYPCIKYERSDSFDFFADNIKYLFYKRYTVTVIDRDPDSLIPDLVEELPFTTFDRYYATAGLNHFVYNLYF